MQTLVAYAFDRAVELDRVAQGRDRVERQYAPLWSANFVRQSADAVSTGVHLWDAADNGSRWPAWESEGDEVAATLHVPLGWTSLVGEVPPERAPIRLAQRLLAEPTGVCELTPPFVLAHLARRTNQLTLYTDMLGVGRLFEVRTSDGWVWSNRPAAALLFAGLAAEASDEGWRFIAACDWAMGDTTAYSGVRTVPPATQIQTNGATTRRSSGDVLSDLCAASDGNDALTDDRLDQTVEALVRTARSVASVWPERPTLSLSGGRDSRLVVASFVAAGVEVSLVTEGTIDGEAVAARALVEALPRPLEHRVRLPGKRKARRKDTRYDGAIDRARGWHDFSEGTHPAQSLARMPPQTLVVPKEPLVGGSAGEVAHGYYYTGDFRRISRLPAPQLLDGYVAVVMARAVLPHGLSPRTRLQAETQIRSVISAALEQGIKSPIALDWFYVSERLRRWGTSGARFGKVLPLLTPEFVRAGFTQSARQRRETALHSALIARLVPQWSEIPFFRATLSERESALRHRLWDDPDKDLVTSLLVDPGEWAEAFDVSEVRGAWRRSASGEAGQRDEQLLQRFVWRQVFDDHVASLNGAALAVRQPADLVQLPRPPRDYWRVARGAATWANDRPIGQRVARTGAGRYLRRKLGV